MTFEDIIIRCQSIARGNLVRQKLIHNKIIKKLRNNPKIMENCFLEIKKILYLFPPAKNENKFIYGKVGELCLIDNINKITPTECLDNNNSIGSEYKNDVIFLEYFKKYSIKIQKQRGNIVIINKNTKDTHSINGLHFIICNIEDKCLYIFTHSEKFEKYVVNSGANISYKGSIITELRKHQEYIYHFSNTKKIENYKKIQKFNHMNIFIIHLLKIVLSK